MKKLFVGDALFAGGNDSPAAEAGAVPIRVRDPLETLRVIEAIIACLSDARPRRIRDAWRRRSTETSPMSDAHG